MIRPARPDDLSALRALVLALADYERSRHRVEASEDDYRALLFGPDPKAFCHVAEVAGDVVGMAFWYETFSTWSGKHGIWLEDLFVVPQHRGGGHGTALLRTLAQLCLERGYPRLEWWVLDWNSPAISFYRAIGAESMEDWTVNRLSGEPLQALASGGAGDPVPDR